MSLTGLPCHVAVCGRAAARPYAGVPLRPPMSLGCLWTRCCASLRHCPPQASHVIGLSVDVLLRVLTLVCHCGLLCYRAVCGRAAARPCAGLPCRPLALCGCLWTRCCASLRRCAMTASRVIWLSARPHDHFLIGCRHTLYGYGITSGFMPRCGTSVRLEVAIVAL